MIKRLTIVLLMLCGIKGASAQSTNGLIVGTNYMMYKPGGVDTPFSEDVSYKSGLGLSVGYRFNWQLNTRWSVVTGLSLNEYSVSKTFFGGTTYELHDDEWLFYASLPVLVDCNLYKKISVFGGYQYSYLTTADIRYVNQNDTPTDNQARGYIQFRAQFALTNCS